MGQTPREFQPVENLEEAIRLVKEGAKTLSSAMIWLKDVADTHTKDGVLYSHLSAFEDAAQTFRCWVPKSLDSSQFMAEVAKTATQECYFSVSLASANIFFRAKLLGIQADGLLFSAPSKVFKVQRRNDVRMPVPPELLMKVEFKDPSNPKALIIKKVLDLSAGGMAILILDKEVEHYPVGSLLENFSFSIQNKKFSIHALVSNSRKLRTPTGGEGTAIGVSFQDLRPGDVQHIATYIFEESRKYFSKFL